MGSRAIPPYALVGDHLGSTSVVANYDGSTGPRQGYKAWGEKRFPTGTSPLPTTFRYTGQRESETFGLYFYGARWYDSSLGRFSSPDTVIPETSQGVQAWDRYAYGNNNPMRYTDPSGHCIDPDSCPQELPTPKPIWSSTQYLTNKPIGNGLGIVSTVAQVGASIASNIGAELEVGCALAGALGGSAALGWVDGLAPVADIGVGLGGLVVGAEVGHAIHMTTTNVVETALSTISTGASIGSDLLLGNTRLDAYQSSATLTIGESTATSAALTVIGNANTSGVGDAIIDGVGAAYSLGNTIMNGKTPGIYSALGIKGTSIPIAGPYHYPTYLKFGDG